MFLSTYDYLKDDIVRYKVELLTLPWRTAGLIKA